MVDWELTLLHITSINFTYIDLLILLYVLQTSMEGL